MPHAVVVGTDPCGLALGHQLCARGFDVTLIEPTNNIGGQWIEKLRNGPDYDARSDGVFLEFPLAPGQSAEHPDPAAQYRKESSNLGTDRNSRSSRPPRTARPKCLSQQANAPCQPQPDETELLEHISAYAHATDLACHVRLGCVLRRAKWTAMNGCWRLELRSAPCAAGQCGVGAGSLHGGVHQSQRGIQLSADLLVVSKCAVAAPRLPRVQGRELYCGTVLTANEQLTGPAGSAVLEQQLRGRHVVVLGGGGGSAEAWAQACRAHAGPGGSVVLLELATEAAAEVHGGASTRSLRTSPQGGGASSRRRTASRMDSAHSTASLSAAATSVVRSGSPGRKRGALARLFGACAGMCGGGDDSAVAEGLVLERTSPAQPAFELTHMAAALAGGEECDAIESGGEVETGLAGSHGDKERRHGLTAAGTGDAAPQGMEPGTQGYLEGADEEQGGGGGDGKIRGSSLMLDSAVRIGIGIGDGDGDAEAEGERGFGTERQATQGNRHTSGRSSLRVLQGVSAVLLHGHHATLGSGQELPADVVLLVPLNDLEPDLGFLDTGPRPRGSVSGSVYGGAGGGGAGGPGAPRSSGSFRRTISALSAASRTSLAGVGDGFAAMGGTAALADCLYRDMVSNSPAVPNLALVGSCHAARHDARTAAVQARWLLSSWVGVEPGGEDDAWAQGAIAAAGFLRQAMPADAAADAALRAKWAAETARHGGVGGGGGGGSQREAGLQRYLGLLLGDLGLLGKGPQVLSSLLSGGVSQPLNAPRVAQLLGLRQLGTGPDLPLQLPVPLAQLDGGGGSPSASSITAAHGPLVTWSRPPSRSRTYSTGGGGVISGGGAAPSLLRTGPDPAEDPRSSCPAGAREQQLLLLRCRSREHGPGSVGSGREGSGVWDGSGGASPHAAARTLLGAQPEALYRVAEDPEQQPAGGRTARVAAADGSGRITAGRAASSALMPKRAASEATSCPSSPGLPYASGCSFSYAAGRSRVQITAGSPNALGGSGGSFGGGVAGATPGSPFGTGMCVGPGGGAGGPEDGVSRGVGRAASMLLRHRSVSRLAGVSHASSSGQPQPAAAVTAGATAASQLPPAPYYANLAPSLRRAPAASASQALAQVPFSLDGSYGSMQLPTPTAPDLDRRSHSGRVSHGGRRTPAGGLHSGGGSTTVLGQRINSAARLQLLLAAASSASRKRNLMSAASGGLDPTGGAGSTAVSPVDREGASGGTMAAQLRAAHGAAGASSARTGLTPLPAMDTLHKSHSEALPVSKAAGGQGRGGLLRNRMSRSGREGEHHGQGSELGNERTSARVGGIDGDCDSMSYAQPRHSPAQRLASMKSQPLHAAACSAPVSPRRYGSYLSEAGGGSSAGGASTAGDGGSTGCGGSRGADGGGGGTAGVGIEDVAECSFYGFAATDANVETCASSTEAQQAAEAERCKHLAEPPPQLPNAGRRPAARRRSITSPDLRVAVKSGSPAHSVNEQEFQFAAAAAAGAAEESNRAQMSRCERSVA